MKNKILVIGNQGMGKTTFIKELKKTHKEHFVISEISESQINKVVVYNRMKM